MHAEHAQHAYHTWPMVTWVTWNMAHSRKREVVLGNVRLLERRRGRERHHAHALHVTGGEINGVNQRLLRYRGAEEHRTCWRGVGGGGSACIA
jgi:hypothetical protein